MDSTWPKVDSQLAAQTEVTIAVQVNGKMRGSFDIAADSDQDTLLKLAQELATVQRDLEGKTIRKTIVVPNRIVNIVAN